MHISLHGRSSISKISGRPPKLCWNSTVSEVHIVCDLEEQSGSLLIPRKYLCFFILAGNGWRYRHKMVTVGITGTIWNIGRNRDYPSSCCISGALRYERSSESLKAIECHAMSTFVALWSPISSPYGDVQLWGFASNKVMRSIILAMHLRCPKLSPGDECTMGDTHATSVRYAELELVIEFSTNLIKQLVFKVLLHVSSVQIWKIIVVVTNVVIVDKGLHPWQRLCQSEFGRAAAGLANRLRPPTFAEPFSDRSPSAGVNCNASSITPDKDARLKCSLTRIRGTIRSKDSMDLISPEQVIARRSVPTTRSINDKRPLAKDLSYHLSQLSQRRRPSPLKELFQYVHPGILSFAGGIATLRLC